MTRPLKPQPRTGRLPGVQILATGSYAPERVVTNDELHATHGFDPTWIIERTGIRERRFAAEHQATSDLCVEAGRQCLDAAGVDAADVDLLVVGTFTPDMSFPSSGCMVQDRMGLNCPAFDVNAACSAFVYSLVTAAQFVGTGVSRRALVIGADVNSRIINPADQKSYPLFGDGAGAVLLAPGGPEQGLLGFQLGSDGSGGPLLCRPACGSRTVPSAEAVERGLHYLTMDGRAVFKWAVRILADSVRDVMGTAGICLSDVHLFIPHQANIRIIKAACDNLSFPRERILTNVDRYGNTSAGSVPLALDEAYREGRIARGDLVLMSGFGAGLTWGTALLRW